MKILDVVKWLLTCTGMGLMISSFVMVLHKEKLMCFSKVGSMEVNPPKRIQNLQISTISNSQNPTLYPQIENKNVHDNHRQTNNNNNNEMWQFKM